MQDAIELAVKPKKRINSRDKGKRGERAWRNVLRSEGFAKAYRAQQYCGSNDSADVICPELPTLHFEVKIGNQVPVKIYDFMTQAVNDCAANTPIVACKRDNCEWLVLMRPDDFFAIVRESDRVKTIHCPDCKFTNVKKNGFTAKLKQKYRCLNESCERFCFIVE